MKELIESFYQQVIGIFEKFSRNSKRYIEKQTNNHDQHNHISVTYRERDFTKLIRKLENKLWLDPQISRELKLNGAQADALKNFKTATNALSVFIADDQEKITRILAAVAAGGNTPDRVDYAIFDATILDRHGIDYEKCPGDTADEEVNKLHIDLKNLTTAQISSLAQNITDEGGLNRLSKEKVKKAITNGLENNFLNKENVRIKI